MPNPAHPPDRLVALTQRIVAFRDARDWAQFHGLKDEVLSLASEVGEVAEAVRWLDEATLAARLQDDDAFREGVGDELADVLYWTLLVAHDAGIDLADAFDAKMTKNEAKYPVHLAKGSPKKYDALADGADDARVDVGADRGADGGDDGTG
ncbi:MAG: nucleotide pyrophosphohydrolase [Trueperaceae bacterium]|nr:nucleotide pyrophosphohydrolase [Trueperaceae bacterium]